MLAEEEETDDVMAIRWEPGMHPNREIYGEVARR